jgi:cold shock CspA family protein
MFDRALDYYCHRWNGLPGVIIEHDGSVRDDNNAGTVRDNGNAAVSNGRYRGVVKAVMNDKRYGFIRVNNDDGSAKDDVFFPFRCLPAGRTTAQKGDAVSFRKETDRRNGNKTFAADIQFVAAAAAAVANGGTVDDGGGANNDDGSATTTVLLPAFFSMGMPFAALLTNGFKTVETRNNRMFADHCPPGTNVLVHVGQRDFDDDGRYLEILKRTGLDVDAVRKLTALPPSSGKGMVVAICEVGSTYELSRIFIMAPRLIGAQKAPPDVSR